MPKTETDYLKSIDSTLKEVLKELKRGNSPKQVKVDGEEVTTYGRVIIGYGRDDLQTLAQEVEKQIDLNQRMSSTVQGKQ